MTIVSTTLTYAGSGNTTATTVNMPATRPDTDKYFAFGAKDGEGAFTASDSDWTEIFNFAGNNCAICLFRYDGASSLNASYEWTHASENVAFVVYRAEDVVATIHQQSSSPDTGSGANSTTPQITPTIDGCDIINFHSVDRRTISGNSFTLYTANENGGANGANDVGFGAASYNQATAAQTPSEAWTHSNDGFCRITIALAPDTDATCDPADMTMAVAMDAATTASPTATTSPAEVALALAVDAPTTAAFVAASPADLSLALAMDAADVVYSAVCDPAGITLALGMDAASTAALAIASPVDIALALDFEAPTTTTTAVSSPADILLDLLVDQATTVATASASPTDLTLALLVEAPDVAVYEITFYEFVSGSKAPDNDNTNHGMSDNKLLTVSVWAQTTIATGARRFLEGENASAPIDLWLDNSNEAIEIRLRSAGAVIEVDQGTPVGSFPNNDRMHHLLIAYDGTDLVIYVDDNEVLNVTEAASADIGWSNTAVDWAFASRWLGGSIFRGFLGDFWFDNSYIDITVEANRRKFITAAGDPMDPGSDGSGYTGSQPVIFFGGGQTAADFGETNLGSGNNFFNGAADPDAAIQPVARVHDIGAATLFDAPDVEVPEPECDPAGLTMALAMDAAVAIPTAVAAPADLLSALAVDQPTTVPFAISIPAELTLAVLMDAADVVVPAPAECNPNDITLAVAMDTATTVPLAISSPADILAALLMDAASAQDTFAVTSPADIAIALAMDATEAFTAEQCDPANIAFALAMDATVAIPEGVASPADLLLALLIEAPTTVPKAISSPAELALTLTFDEPIVQTPALPAGIDFSLTFDEPTFSTTAVCNPNSILVGTTFDEPFVRMTYIDIEGGSTIYSDIDEGVPLSWDLINVPWEEWHTPWGKDTFTSIYTDIEDT